MTFRDLRTGETVTVSNPRRAMRMRLRTDRYEEVIEPSERVPDGTVGDVLAWAGDNPARRQVALAAEKAGKRRKGVLDALS